MQKTVRIFALCVIVVVIVIVYCYRIQIALANVKRPAAKQNHPRNKATRHPTGPARIELLQPIDAAESKIISPLSNIREQFIHKSPLESKVVVVVE